MWHEYYFGMHWIWWLMWSALFLMYLIILVVTFNMHDNDDSVTKKLKNRFNKQHHA